MPKGIKIVTVFRKLLSIVYLGGKNKALAKKKKLVIKLKSIEKRKSLLD